MCRGHVATGVAFPQKSDPPIVQFQSCLSFLNSSFLLVIIKIYIVDNPIHISEEIYDNMAITVNIYYTGHNGSAREFAAEMTGSGVVEEIRNEEGNLRYEYFYPLEDAETVLLIDSWADQAALDRHHASPMMEKIIALREKYALNMKVERYLSEDTIPDSDKKFIKAAPHNTPAAL